MTKKLTAAEEYRRKRDAAQPEPELVTLTAPSGYEFIFHRPSRYDLIFNMGQLPLNAASRALEGWKEKGVGDDEGEVNADQERIFKTVFSVRDRVLKLSHKPKLVVGPADEAKGELSTSDVSDPDLEFLFSFVASGGNASAQLATFPGGPGPSASPQPNRKGRRAAAKSASRAG